MTRYFLISYTKANGQQGTLNVKGNNEANALGNAKFGCFTGRNFQIVDEIEKCDTINRKSGYAGSNKSN